MRAARKDIGNFFKDLGIGALKGATDTLQKNKSIQQSSSSLITAYIKQNAKWIAVGAVSLVSLIFIAVKMASPKKL